MMPFSYTRNSMKRLGLSGSFLFCAALIAAATLPPQFHVPGGFAVLGLHFFQFGTSTFESPLAGKTERVDVEGHVWEFWLGSDVRPVADPAVTAVRIAAALKHDGWSVL